MQAIRTKTGFYRVNRTIAGFLNSFEIEDNLPGYRVTGVTEIALYGEDPKVCDWDTIESRFPDPLGWVENEPSYLMDWDED